MKLKKITFMLLLTLLTLWGCQAAENNQTKTDQQQNKDTLKIGLMPAVDSAPIFVAEREGIFAELGLELEATVYSNANNRQSALQANELDGAMTDLIAFLNNLHNGFETKIVMSTDGSFAFLTNDNFVEDQTQELGLMEISVSNYLADQYVVPQYEVNKVYIAEIPARLEMIATGQLDIGFIPEPAASQGELNGLNKQITITDDEGESLQAMVFTSESLANNQEAIIKFTQGYNQAVELIQANPELALDALIEELELNPEIRDLITLPDYHLARVPSEAYIDQVIEWVESIQDINLTVSYQTMIADKVYQSRP
ncbi:ABC transporter substrate-binding protein [Amphibacillus sediminis]|uniref:ABC transporter substrate-binding protein n=1 Tax=Amphibacillus sediminis TaxID=360185 RepID=UPI000829648C|nr:ABC transporter substrate-binding protein [Amphibacillus sediminis]